MQSSKHYLISLVASFLLVSSFANGASAQEPVMYQWYNAKGKKVKWDKVVKQSAAAQVVFFGEFHDNSVAHWWQLQLAHALHKAHGSTLTLGFEMFERDVQPVLDSFLREQTTKKEFLASVRPWPNYETDYAPLIYLAIEHKLNAYATNIPRRYARTVAREGVDALYKQVTEEEKTLMMPLPVVVDTSLPSYAAMMKMMPGHGSGNFVYAQAVKDATMAHSIARVIKGGKRMLHINGSYHSDGKEGIVHFLQQYAPGTSSITITTVMQNEVGKLEQKNEGKADFILVTPVDVPRSH